MERKSDARHRTSGELLRAWVVAWASMGKVLTFAAIVPAAYGVESES